MLVPPGAVAAQRAFASWGWRKAARARDGEDPGDLAAPVLDVMLIGLPVPRPWLRTRLAGR